MRATITRGITALLLLFALFGCASTKVTENPLAGRWYGEDFQPFMGGVAKWLIDRRPDGMYTVTFRRYRDNRMIQEQTEGGRWAYSSGLYATFTQSMDGKTTDPKDEHFHDLYFVENLEGEEMVYKHIKSGLTFRAKRVGNEFKLP